MVQETKPPNDAWEQAVVDSLAEKMKKGGYSLTSKAFPYLIAALVSLVGVVYGYIVTNIQSLQAEVTAVQIDHKAISVEIQTMSANIYLLCQSSNAPKCLKPDP